MLKDILLEFKSTASTPGLLSPYSFRVKTLFIGWIVVMISVPIALWTLGPATTPYTLLLGVCIQALLLMQLLGDIFGVGRMLLLFGWIALLGWLAEWIGTSTGLPFGTYAYTDMLKPQIQHVPLLIPLAWFMMLPIAVALSQGLMYRFVPQIEPSARPFRYRLCGALIAAVVMTAWDLLLDPHMVSWGFWEWETGGRFSFFGIPWSNYGGWLLVSFCMAFPVYHLSFYRVRYRVSGSNDHFYHGYREQAGDSEEAKNRQKLYFLVWSIYAITWFLETFGQLFFWGLIGPALTGGFIMGYISWVSRPDEIINRFSRARTE